MTLPLVIYPEESFDGWCAAWIMDRCLGGCELIPASYGDDPPNVDGRTVFVLDFSFPRAVMMDMHSSAHKLLVLDHHKTAEEDCKDLPFCVFDKERSAAGLTYWWCKDMGYIAHLLSGSDRDIASGMKVLADYVQDRDLFNFALDFSEVINAAIRSYPWNLEVWDQLARRMQVTPTALVTEGAAIQRYRDQLIEQHTKHSHYITIDNCLINACVCTAGDIISDVCGTLAKGHMFAATYCPTTDGQVLVSLRSDKHGLDVGAIAKKYGGVGHKHAAGFKVPFVNLVAIDPQTGVHTA